MAISRAVQNHLAKGRFDAIEDEWLSQLQVEELDPEYFSGVARALAGQGEAERSCVLLETLDEHLTGKQLWTMRLSMLRRVGELLFPAPADLHQHILSTLRALHPDHPQFEALTRIVGLDKAIEDIPKTWTKVDRLVELLAFSEGSVLFMEGKGAGRVVEVNTALASFKIDFPKHPGLKVGFKAAPKLLTVLPSSHIQMLKLESSQQLLELKSDCPAGELLGVVLKSYERPLTAVEIRENLEGIIDAKEWTSWWAGARKDHRVVSSTGGRQSYRWLGEGEEAVEAHWQQFEKASLDGKLELFRRSDKKQDSLQARMAQRLIDEAESLGDQAASEKTVEIWFALDRSDRAPADVDWSAAARVSRSDPSSLIHKLRDRSQRKRLLELCRDLRSDWSASFYKVLQGEPDAKLISFMTGELSAADPKRYERFLDEVLSQPRKRPAAFLWLAEQGCADETLLLRNPMRFLQNLLAANSWEEFSPYRQRLAATFESGAAAAKALVGLNEEQSTKAFEAIRRAPLQEYLRTPLLNALKLRFGALDSDRQSPLYALRSSIDEKKKELEHLKTVEIPDNRRAIEVARAHGDLRENFEYHAARQRHEYLSARLAQLHSDLARALPIDPSTVASGEVRVGATVELQSPDGEKVITILGPWESDPENGVISYESELGQGLLGKAAGATVTIAGADYSITGIRPSPS